MIKVNDNEVIKWAAGSQPINRAYDGDNLIFPGISGSAPSGLPSGFVFNFNARDYDPATRTIPAEDGALETNAFILQADPVAYNGDSLTIDSSQGSSKKMIAEISSGKTQYYSIDGTNNRAATWIFKYSRSGDGENCHFLSNRYMFSDYNWMVRAYDGAIRLHDSSERNECPVSTYPCTAVIRIADDGTTTIQDITDGTACTPYTFDYGRANATPTFFAGYYGGGGGEYFQGMFYWAFFANRCLTDAEVTQVIDYNEN